jgi:hypothetical protein
MNSPRSLLFAVRGMSEEYVDRVSADRFRVTERTAA